MALQPSLRMDYTMTAKSKATDTPKAATTGRATKSPAVKAAPERVVSTERIAAFIALVGKDDAIRVAKVKHIAKELASGSTVGGLTSSYSAALIAANKVVPIAFQSSISQAKAVSERAKLVKLTDPKLTAAITDSVILSTLSLVNVSKANVEKLLASFNGSAAAYAVAVIECVRADRATKAADKLTKGSKGAKAPADTDSDSDAATVTTESALTPATFAQVLGALNSMLSAETDKTKRYAMLTALDNVQRRFTTASEKVAAPKAAAVTPVMRAIQPDAIAARRAAAKTVEVAF